MESSGLLLGYCSLGNEKAFPEEIINEVRIKTLSAVESFNIPIIHFNGLISTYKDADKAGASELPWTVWESILWTSGKNVELLPLTALIEITSSASKLGIDFECVIGNPEDQMVLKDIERYLTVIQSVNYLKRARIALIGYCSPGMVDVTPDEIAMRRCIGAELMHLDLSELLTEFQRTDNTKTQKEFIFLKSASAESHVEDIDIEASVKLHQALKAIVNRYCLSAVAIRCWPELKSNLLGLRGTPCYALSELSNEGIIGVCEADLSSSITMLLLSKIAKSVPVVLDFNTVDYANNSLTFWHCGAHATALAGGMNNVSLRHPSEGGMKEVTSGMALEFSLPSGKGTFAKISREYDKILITKADFVTPKIKFRGGIAQAVWAKNVRDLLSLVVNRGFEHHICAVYGVFDKELKLAAKLLKLNVTDFTCD